MSLQKSILAVCAAISLLLASCTTFAMSDVAYIKNQPASVKVLGEFSTTVWVNQFMGSSGGAKLFNLTANDQKAVIKAAIEAEIAKLGGDAAINISVVEEAGFGEILLNSFTAGIYAPVSVRISGTVIRY